MCSASLFWCCRGACSLGRMLLLQRTQRIFADDDENIEAVHRFARGGFVESLHAAKSQCGNDLFRFLFDIGGIVARAVRKFLK